MQTKVNTPVITENKIVIFKLAWLTCEHQNFIHFGPMGCVNLHIGIMAQHGKEMAEEL